MAFGTQDDTDDVMNEINMTPLVDVVMVILIFLMLTGTFAVGEHFLQSNLPLTRKGSGLSTPSNVPPDEPLEIRLVSFSRPGPDGLTVDMWQAHVIAQDASTNGIGIAKDIKVRLLELEYLLERYCVGKSAAFKQYCTLALESVGVLPRNIPALPPHERADFQRAYKILKDNA